MESRILQLIAALRASGVRVSLAESAEAFSAVDLMGIQHREHFRLSLRSTLIKDLRNLPIFDKLFPLFFGNGQPPMMGGNPTDDMTPEEAQMLADALRQFAQSLRQRMKRALAFPEVREALRELMEQLQQMGMSKERLEQMREMIQQNMQGLEQQIRQFAGERIAENLSEQPPGESADNLMNRPFHALGDDEKKILQREVKRLAAALRTRIALRQKRAKSGQLDPKSTIRSNLKYHGVPMELKYRDRTRKPKIVVICDVSTSMRFCSEVMLSFLFALQGQIRKTHAFAFIDHLEYISNDFNGSDADEADFSPFWRIPSGHYNTDLGWSLNDFNKEYLDTLNGQTTLIIVGDGRNNYNDPRVDIFSLMARRAARTIWLNPEPPVMWHGDSDMTKYAPLCNNVLKVGNLRELVTAVDQLLSA